MPGSPIVYYGDEIGMGDNIFLGDRNGVRTPMQWTPDRNAGFSKADPQRLYLPPIMDAVYGYEAVNVEAQNRDPGSLLNWMKRMLGCQTSRRIRPRRLTFLRPALEILAYARAGCEAILCVANAGRSAQRSSSPSTLTGRYRSSPGRTPFPPERPAYMLTRQPTASIVPALRRLSRPTGTKAACTEDCHSVLFTSGELLRDRNRAVGIAMRKKTACPMEKKKKNTAPTSILAGSPPKLDLKA